MDLDQLAVISSQKTNPGVVCHASGIHDMSEACNSGHWPPAVGQLDIEHWLQPVGPTAKMKQGDVQQALYNILESQYRCIPDRTVS